MSTETPLKMQRIGLPEGLSGFVCVKNAISLDYCIEECILSMLPLCDEVVVGDMGSDDGTRDMLADWAMKQPKLNLVKIRDWTQERGNMSWWTSALNETRQHIGYSMALGLDADEILSDDDVTIRTVMSAVREKRAIALDRLNFARDAHSLIPEGECCGKHVVRVGPSDLWWPSDEPHKRGEVPLLDMATITPEAKIFHMGFLRKREAFYKKARVVLGAFFNDYDQRLKRSELSADHPFAEFPWFNRLTPYQGYYPQLARNWLQARGYSI